MEAALPVIDPATHTFTIPTKTLVTMEDLEKFKTSNAFKEIITFVAELQASVEHKANSEVKSSSVLAPIEEVLSILSGYVDSIPPLEQPMRFGNKAFRLFLDKAREDYSILISKILKTKEQMRASEELKEYFMDAFGSYERIDYGTGHELNFLVFLYVLYRIGYYNKSNFPALVNVVFVEYIKLMRKLQLTYMLEPAGSHGVWGLDDYHFLPFIFGASQLKDHGSIEPKSIHNDKILATESKNYMYLDCIRFIKEVKKGVPFAESSPTLNDISNVMTWKKIANGMIKMYQAEVLSKHPVIKHLRFGSVLKFNSPQ
jgi:serine/threonine-protein phosphatase 2A activator